MSRKEILARIARCIEQNERELARVFQICLDMKETEEELERSKTGVYDPKNQIGGIEQ